jgi:hypothetical protein
MPAARAVSSAIAAAARLVARVGPNLATSSMAATASAPARIAATTCTWLMNVGGVPGWFFCATPATAQPAA